jgi:hypothetical protein
VAALVPAFDPRGFKGREWRSAGAAALVVHALLIAAIVVVGKYALATFVDTRSPEHVRAWVTDKIDEPDTPKPSNGGSPADDAPSTGSDGGGGGNTDPKPVTGGQPPPMMARPPLPPIVTPPVQHPALVVPTAVQGPDLTIPVPPNVGAVGVPPAPDDPSLGPNGGTGAGPGTGPGYGPGTGPGTGDGPGGPGGRNGTGPTTRPGGTGPGTGVGDNPLVPALNTPDRGVRLVRKARPVLTKAMIENNTFGTVTFRVTIGADGRILSAEPVNTLGNGGTQAALDALYRCKFDPAIRNQRYVAESTVVRFDVRPN